MFVLVLYRRDEVEVRGVFATRRAAIDYANLYFDVPGDEYEIEEWNVNGKKVGLT